MEDYQLFVNSVIDRPLKSLGVELNATLRECGV